MLKNHYRTFVLFTLLLVFSFWLMLHTFSYNSQTRSLLLATKVWSDFAAHIPLIRSFSLGNNWPPEYPLLPGVPIKYHFLFDFLAGQLEKAGLTIAWAYNLPSALGFFLLLSMIGALAWKLFRNRWVVCLSLIFFLFNGSLAFLRFFLAHPFSWETPRDIFRANTFPAFAPWGPGDISAFWNLNIYTNQRHLGLAFGLALLFIYGCLVLEKKRLKAQLLWVAPYVGLLTIFPFFHEPTLLILTITLTTYFIFFPKLRRFLFIVGSLSLVLILPQLRALGQERSALAWYPGYLIHDNLSAWRFLTYWWQNLGLHSLFIPIGFLLSPRLVKKALIPIFFIFIIANLFKFSVEVAASHKFFNFVLILGNICSAYALVRAARVIRQIPSLVLKIVSFSGLAVIILLMTLSGLVDFFVVINDTQIVVPDIPADPVATWIVKNTPPDAVFLNSRLLYHPATLAGRKIFQGWPYFTWSAGYTENRLSLMKLIYESKNPLVFCPLLLAHNISYITVEDTRGDPNLPVIDVNYFLNHFTASFHIGNQYAIFTTHALCQNSP